MNIRRARRLIDRDLNVQLPITIPQLAGQCKHLPLIERRSPQIQKTRTRVAHFPAEITTRPQHTQHTPIMEVIRGHHALLCVNSLANPLRRPSRNYANNNLT